MKTLSFASVQLTLTALFLTFCTSAFSQSPNTWKGGTPGMEQEWDCPKNWSASRVPDEFTDVFIPDVSAASLALPVIGKGAVEINSLRIVSNATLTVEKNARLLVYGDAEGITAQSVVVRGYLSFVLEGGKNLNESSVAVRIK